MYVKLKLKLVNPFNFPIGANTVGLRLGYDDPDGEIDDLGDYPIRTRLTNPEFGNRIGDQRTVKSLGDFVIQPAEEKWTPYLDLMINNLWTNGWRLYDEYQQKKRLCLHVLEGLVDISLSSAGSPFLFSLPFQVRDISIMSDNDCVRAPQDCEIWSDANQNAGHYRSVFDYTNMYNSRGAFQKNGNAEFTGSYLRLCNDDNHRGSAFTTATYDMRDSFEIQFVYNAKKIETSFFNPWPLGHADGIALVLTDGPATSLGGTGGGGDDFGHGYKDIPGNSFAAILNTYSDGSAGFFRNGGCSSGAALCNNPNFQAAAGHECKKGFILRTGDLGSSLKNQLVETDRTVRLRYDGIRHTMFFQVYLNSGWFTFVQAQVNLEEIFGTNVGNVRIGLTASTGNHYYDEPRVKSLRFRRAKISAAHTKVVEDGRVVGAVHDAKSQPFVLTIDGKDVCGHDRGVAGEPVSVRLLHKTQGSSHVVTVPTTCSGTSPRGVGTCAKTVTNPGSHPPNQEVGGMFEVRWLTALFGWYDVELTAGGATHVVGQVYVAE